MYKKIFLSVGFVFGLVTTSFGVHAAGVFGQCDGITPAMLDNLNFNAGDSVILNEFPNGGGLCVAFDLTSIEVTMLSVVLTEARSQNLLVSLGAVSDSPLSVTVVPRL